MPHQDVVLFHRSPTLEIRAVLPFTALDWTRRFRGGGEFHADLPPEFGASNLINNVACGDILEIELDGRTELTGVVQRRSITYQPDHPAAWTIEGLDLTWWLHQRVILPPAGQSHDEQTAVPAETAIRHYITDHLLSPLDLTRQIPVPAALEPAHTPPLGPDVTLSARYKRLAKQIDAIAATADLGYGAERDANDTVRFCVRADRDRTAASPAPVIFSPQLGTAETLSYTEDGVDSRNALYVLGAGGGATRLVETVLDSDDIAARGRRELSLDARDASTSAAAIDAGQAEIARQAAARLQLRTTPPHLAPFDYRVDWDVGDVVTLSLPELALQLDRRIDEVRCSLDAETPLTIDCTFGARALDAAAALARLDDRTAPARFE